MDDEIRTIIKRVNDGDHPQEFWHEAGAKILAFIDEITLQSERVNKWCPKGFSSHNNCLIATLFRITDKIANVNQPFLSELFDELRKVSGLTDGSQDRNKISFYELAYSRCCSFISQLLGDRFGYIQKLLIKNVFGPSNVCSLLASDIYIFVMRIVHPNRRISMCQIVMHLCRMSPPEALVKGAALINRIKNPIVNFENTKYQHILNFS